MSKKQKLAGRPNVDEVDDYIDVIDQMNKHIDLLREIAKLIEVASFQLEPQGSIPLVHLAGDMADRLEIIKKLSSQLFDCCRKWSTHHENDHQVTDAKTLKKRR